MGFGFCRKLWLMGLWEHMQQIIWNTSSEVTFILNMNFRLELAASLSITEVDLELKSQFYPWKGGMCTIWGWFLAEEERDDLGE